MPSSPNWKLRGIADHVLRVHTRRSSSNTALEASAPRSSPFPSLATACRHRLGTTYRLGVPHRSRSV